MDDIIQDEEDYGCICEIDLSQRNKIRKIISELLYQQTSKSSKPAAENNNKKSKKKTNYEPPTFGSAAGGLGVPGMNQGFGLGSQPI